MLKHIIEYVVKSLVDSPEGVVVTITQAGEKDIFEIKVDTQDIGKVIGKEGQTIRALRMMVNALNSTNNEVEITIAK
ncbi:MAG: KH domain-containing protein [Candidatus Babeliales bacterium]|nr:KH domain-containing protein [Candidatus Babeliales bacterium]